MDDKDFSEKAAQEWISTIESERSSIRENDIYPELRLWLDDLDVQNVLDIGCGQGICSAKISLDNKRYIGIDPSPILIERAKELYDSKEKSFLVGSAYSIPLDVRSIDAVFSIAVWHLLSDLPLAVHEMSRVLKPGGSFFVITADPNAVDNWTSYYEDLNFVGKRFEGRAKGTESIDVLYFHPYNEISQTLQASGLEITQQKCFRNFLLIKGVRRS